MPILNRAVAFGALLAAAALSLAPSAHALNKEDRKLCAEATAEPASLLACVKSLDKRLSEIEDELSSRLGLGHSPVRPHQVHQQRRRPPPPGGDTSGSSFPDEDDEDEADSGRREEEEEEEVAATEGGGEKRTWVLFLAFF